MGNITLYELTSEHHLIMDAIEEAGGEITPEIEQMLAINAENFATKAEGYAEVITKYAHISANAAERIKQLQVVKKVADNAERRMKERLQSAMEEYGLTKVECGLRKLSLRTSQAVEIIDEAKLPNEYIKVSTTIDKSALRADLMAGVVVEGAELKTNKSLTIR